MIVGPVIGSLYHQSLLVWMLQITMTYIFPSLKIFGFVDIPPLPVRVIARKSVHSTGSLLVAEMRHSAICVDRASILPRLRDDDISR